MSSETKFISAVEQLISVMSAISDDDIVTLKAEIAVESIADWSQTGTHKEVVSWFLKNQQDSTMSTEVIPLTECIGWSFDDKMETFCHESGEFFKIEGIRVHTSPSREVQNGWDQPIVTQIGYDGGILGLLRMRVNGIPHYLVEAKAEPGNPDGVQICPTLQATFSNLNRAHGGRKPRFSEYFENLENTSHNILFRQWFSEDGGRLNKKRNLGIIIEVDFRDSLLSQPNNFKWVSLYQLKKLISLNSYVSPHIRSLVSTL
jgi:oxidase EvaA